MSIENVAQVQQEQYQHWSKNINFKGAIADPNEYPILTKESGRFYKGAEEKSRQYNLKDAWKKSMKRKYGDNWKQEMKKLHIYN